MHVEDGLELVKAPYVNKHGHKKYVLVLDLDETLLHYYEVTINSFNVSIERRV